jgi:hypothetical protein
MSQFPFPFPFPRDHRAPQRPLQGLPRLHRVSSGFAQHAGYEPNSTLSMVPESPMAARSFSVSVRSPGLGPGFGAPRRGPSSSDTGLSGGGALPQARPRPLPAVAAPDTHARESPACELSEDAGREDASREGGDGSGDEVQPLPRLVSDASAARQASERHGSGPGESAVAAAVPGGGDAVAVALASPHSGTPGGRTGGTGTVLRGGEGKSEAAGQGSEGGELDDKVDAGGLNLVASDAFEDPEPWLVGGKRAVTSKTKEEQ